MSEINKIKERIAVINAESKRLNNERNVNLGKLETLNTQLNNALADYKSKYGVELDIKNLSNEITKVSSDIEKRADEIQSILDAINSGDYDKANQLAGVEVATNSTETVSEPSEPSEPVSEPSEPVAPPVSELNEPVAPPVSELNEPVAPPVSEPVAPPVSEPVAPPASEPVAPPVSEPNEPNNVGDNVTSFNAILSGSAFGVN